MKKIILAISLLISANASYAEDIQLIENEDHQVRLLKKVQVSDKGYVYLSARDNGHVLGQNFIIETRVSCNGEVLDFTELEVLDSYSVCNMKPESIVKNTKGTALAMLAKSANINQYYDEIAEGVTSPIMQCKKGNEVLKFSLQNLCN